MKMKYVQIQQQIKIIQNAVIAILKSEKSQNQITENGKKRDNKKSAWKRDIDKQIKLKERERQCKCRKNIQKICLSKKDSKSLKNKSVPGKRKSENEICTIVKKKTNK